MENEKRLLTAVEQTRQQYVESYQRALRLLSYNQKHDAAAMIADETVPALLKYHNAWEEFAEYQRAQLDKEAKKAETDYQTTRRIALLVITLAVSVFLLIGALATRQASMAWRHEVVARRRAEGKLLRSEERIRMAARAANIGSWERNLVTGTNTWSDNTYMLLGLRREITASFEAFINSVHPTIARWCKRDSTRPFSRGGISRRNFAWSGRTAACIGWPPQGVSPLATVAIRRALQVSCWTLISICGPRQICGLKRPFWRRRRIPQSTAFSSWMATTSGFC